MSFDDKGNLIPVTETRPFECQVQMRRVREEAHEGYLDFSSLYPQLNIAGVITSQTPYNRPNKAKKARNAFIKASK